MAQNASSSIMPWSFDYVTSWLRGASSQLGLFNISFGSTADPEVEKEVVEKVGTYGRQLGRISDVLRVVVNGLDKKELSLEEQKAVRAFLTQVDMVDDIKARHR